MRTLTVTLISACLLVFVACRGQSRTDDGRIELGQNVTTNAMPRDKDFKDFEKNWRKFISSSTELASSVARPETPQQTPWEPIVVTECVYSPDANGAVPQATLTWNEPVGGGPEIARASQRQEPQSQPPSETPRLRFDLAIHHNALGRNYFSSILARDKAQRFQLPPNSGLVKDEQAVVLAGPALFPKLMDFRTESLQDRDTKQQFEQRTLIMRDLSEGLTYTITLDQSSGSAWNELRRFSFLTPVCPKGS